MGMMQYYLGKSDLCVAGLGIDPHEALWAEEKQGLLDQLGHCCQLRRKMMIRETLNK